MRSHTRRALRLLAAGSFLCLLTAMAAADTAKKTSSPADTTQSEGKDATPKTAEDEVNWLDWEKMTGDWGGARTELSKHGIDLDFRLSQYYQGVASGGVNTNFAYGGTMDYRINIDAGKLANLKGLSFNMHARSRFGRDINSDAGALALQNAGMLMPAPGGYHDTDITGLTATYMFPFLAERTGALTVGKLDVVDLVTSFFPNVGYGQEGFMNVNAQVSAMPWFGAVQGLSLYGGVVITIHPKYKVPESGFAVTGTHNISTEWGSLSDSFEDGVWIAGFHRFFWELDGKMGYFMVFAAASTKKQASNDPNDFVYLPGQGITNTDTKRPWDVAFYLYQDIWQSKDNPKRKANIMIGATVGPDNPQFSNWNIFGNVEMFGPFESRPNDRKKP